jgi:glyoxylase-like metal-dependent hydrolase (beta-lactamase superfamily II)
LERVEIPPIDIDLAETARLRFGGLEIAVVHTPGHTPGSVCLEVGGMLLTGDTLIATESGNARMPEGDADAWRTSLRRLAAAYSAETQIYPGHGAPGVLGDAISRLRESPE